MLAVGDDQLVGRDDIDRPGRLHRVLAVGDDQLVGRDDIDRPGRRHRVLAVGDDQLVGRDDIDRPGRRHRVLAVRDDQLVGRDDVDCPGRRHRMLAVGDDQLVGRDDIDRPGRLPLLVDGRWRHHDLWLLRRFGWDRQAARLGRLLLLCLGFRLRLQPLLELLAQLLLPLGRRGHHDFRLLRRFGWDRHARRAARHGRLFRPSCSRSRTGFVEFHATLFAGCRSAQWVHNNFCGSYFVLMSNLDVPRRTTGRPRNLRRSDAKYRKCR